MSPVEQLEAAVLDRLVAHQEIVLLDLVLRRTEAVGVQDHLDVRGGFDRLLVRDHLVLEL